LAIFDLAFRALSVRLFVLGCEFQPRMVGAASICRAAKKEKNKTKVNESGPFPQLGDDFPHVEGLSEEGGRIAFYAT
jgi:hypothetical protein